MSIKYNMSLASYEEATWHRVLLQVACGLGTYLCVLVATRLVGLGHFPLTSLLVVCVKTHPTLMTPSMAHATHRTPPGVATLVGRMAADTS